jgi:predicted transcriptional regulator
MADDQENSIGNSLDIAREITVAWLSNPNVNASASDVPAFLKAMHATISELSNSPAIEPAEAPVEFLPAVPVRSSIKPDYLVSLIDGRKFKTLKRHLALNGLTPADYRERYGLKSDYPMVAANYSEHRREVARNLGLGRKPAPAVEQEQAEAADLVTEASPARPKRGPAKARTVKAATEEAQTSSEPTELERAEPVVPDIDETITAKPVPKPKAKRVFARPSDAQPELPAEDTTSSAPTPKKARAASKSKVDVKPEDDPAINVTSPRRGRPKKQLTEI